jgi:hypothetical protein
MGDRVPVTDEAGDRNSAEAPIHQGVAQPGSVGWSSVSRKETALALGAAGPYKPGAADYRRRSGSIPETPTIVWIDTNR